nr:DUF1413 domain-containing protein [Marinicella sp. W31]MDC2879397.1 DUF1413 domain-containing protein [Marinicella sp. W31]
MLDEDEIANRLLAQEPGAFHFPEVYGENWNRLPIGDKVKIGREFLNAVRKGCFPGVEDTGRKNGGGRVYLKR